MRWHDPAFEARLRSVYRRRTGRSRRLEPNFPWAEPIGGVLATGILPLALVAVLPASMVDAGERAPLFIALWTVFALVRGGSVGCGFWAGLTNPATHRLPLGPGRVVGEARIGAARSALGLPLENAAVLAGLQFSGGLDAPVLELAASSLLLGWVQIGFAAILLRFSSDEGPPTLMAWLWTRGLLGLVFLAGVRWILPLFGQGELASAGLNLVAEAVSWLPLALPSGWALGSISGASEIWMPMAALLAGGLPLFGWRDIEKRALQAVARKSGCYPPADSWDDEDGFERDSEAVYLTDEVSGERWEARGNFWIDDDGNLAAAESGVPVITLRRAYRLDEMRERARKGMLLEKRAFGTSGWIESLCARTLSARDRATLNVIVDWEEAQPRRPEPGVGYTRTWWRGVRWLFVTALLAAVWKLGGGAPGLLVAIGFAMGLILLFTVLPMDSKLRAAWKLRLPLSRWAIERLALKITAGRTLAAFAPVLATGAFAAWLFGWEARHALAATVIALVSYFMQSGLWTAAQGDDPQSGTARVLRLGVAFGNVLIWFLAAVPILKIAASPERWPWAFAIWGGFGLSAATGSVLLAALNRTGRLH